LKSKGERGQAQSLLLTVRDASSVSATRTAVRQLPDEAELGKPGRCFRIRYGQLNLDIFWLKDGRLENSANLAGLKRVNPACPASLDTLKVSVPPAVKLTAGIRAQSTPDPDIIAVEIDSCFPNRSPLGLPVYVGRSHDLHCRRFGICVIAINRCCFGRYFFSKSDRNVS
jgi:hypothetical protein